MPVSKVQLGVLLGARVVEPIGYTVLLPFINAMVEHLLPDVPNSQIGRYSGAMQSVFALATVVCMYHWGRLSDRIGRKPVILSGLIGVTLCFTLLGLSRNIWWALGVRALGGALCGNASVMRAALGDMTTPEDEGWVYPLWTICWDLSCVIGPTIGAILQSPTIQYPNSWFGRSRFMRDYPFFLPCAFVACLSASALFMVLIAFEDTNRKVSKTDENEPLLPVKEEEPMGVRALFAIQQIRAILASGFLLTLSALSFDAGFVLFCYSQISSGGIGLTPKAIATCLSIKGGLSMTFSLLVFPRILRRYGPLRLYRLFTPCWIFAYTLPPIMTRLASTSTGIEWVTDGKLKMLWIFMAPLVVAYVLGDGAFPLHMILLNRAAPSKHALGGLNAISLVVSAIAKISGSFIIGTLFGYSSEVHVPIVWLVFIMFACLGTLQSWSIKDSLAEDVPANE